MSDRGVWGSGWRASDLFGALSSVWRVGRTLRRAGGLKLAIELLADQVTEASSRREPPRSPLTVVAWDQVPSRLAWFFVVASRGMFGRESCIFESFTCCAGLRRMGYDAEVVVGYEIASSMDRTTPLHAWVELKGVSPLLVDRQAPDKFTPVVRILSVAAVSPDEAVRASTSALESFSA